MAPKKLGLPPRPEIPTARGQMLIDPPNAAPPTGAVLGTYPGEVAQAQSAPPFGMNFPAPPAVSLTPDFTGTENAPAPGIMQTVPSMRDLAGQATEVMGGNQDYSKARELLHGLVADDHTGKQKKIEDEMLKIAQSVGLDLGTDPAHAAGALGSLGDGDASSFGSDGGLLTRMLTFHSRQKAAEQANARANATSRIGVLKFYKDAVDSGDKNAMDVATKLISLGGDWKDLLKEAGTNERFNTAQAGLADARGEKARHNQATEARLNALEQIKESLAPAQYEMLKARITGEGLKNQTAQAVLPYAGEQAQAKLSLTKNLANAVDPRTAVAGMAATGQAATPEMMQRIGLQTAAPEVVPDVVSPTATTPIAAPLTPKAQDAHAKTEAGIEHTNAATKEVTNRANLELEKLVQRGRRMVSAGTSGANFWAKNPDAFDSLPDTEKKKIKALYKQEQGK